MGSHGSRATVALVLVLMCLAPASALGEDGASPGEDASADPAGGRAGPQGVPGFLENGGQLGEQSVRYYAWSDSGGIALTDDGAVLTVVGRDADGLPLGCNVAITFQGCADVEPEGGEPLPGTTNFLRGQDPTGWRTGLRTFDRVFYEDLWDGVDLVYSVAAGTLKYDLLLDSGADGSDVVFRVEGHDALAVSTGGDLVMSTAAGTLVDSGLMAFYADGAREAVDCAFDLLGPDGYTFRLGDRDLSRPVVIDPVVFSTFVGGGQGELEVPWAGVALDSAGNALVAGFASTTDFPVTSGAFQLANAGGETDVFVLKLAAAGDTLQYATYIGGDDADYPYDIALDTSGRAVLVGRTNSTDFPTTSGAFDTQHTGADEEGFVLKVAADGSSLVYSTFLGGNDTDEIVALSVDSSGFVTFTGNTKSTDLPTTSGVLQPSHGGGGYDTFLGVLSAAGSQLVMLTYIGGNLWDLASDIFVDTAFNMYLCGQTYSTDFPVTNGTYQDFLMMNYTDGYVIKVAPSGTSVVWGTFLGGIDFDSADHIHVAANGSVTVVGQTDSPGYPATADAFQVDHGGLTDIFVTRLAANGSVLEYSTFIGGSLRDECAGLAVDANGNTHLTGRTNSDDFPTLPGALQEKYLGENDTFVLKMDDGGTQALYASYLGGTAADLGYGIDLAANGDAVLVGGTDSVDFPTTTGVLQEDIGGMVDLFVTRIDLFLDIEPPVAVPGVDMIVDQHTTVDLDGSMSTDNVGVVNWTWTFTYNGTDLTFYGATMNWTFDLAGKYYVTLTVRDAVGNAGSQWVSVYVRDIELPVAVAPDDMVGQQHWTFTLDGLGSHDNVGIDTYTWTFTYADANKTLRGGKVDFVFDESGEFTVTLNVSDAEGNWATDTVIVTVWDTTAPDADAGPDIVIDQHTRVTFNGTGSTDNMAVHNLTWQLVYTGVPIQLFGPTPTFTFDRVGVYDVNLIVIDAAGNQGVDGMRVTVRDSTPPVAVGGNDITIDQLATVNLDGSPSTDNVRVDRWKWTIVHGDEVTSFEGSVTSFTFGQAGIYNITLNVSDPAGNWDTDSFKITVRDTTDPVADAGENLVAKQGDTVWFDGTNSSDNVAIVSWSWTFRLGSVLVTLTGPTPNHTFNSVGTYLVDLQVIDSSGLSSFDDIRVVVLDSEPPVAVVNGPFEILEDSSVRLNSTGSSDNEGIVRFTWSFNYNQALMELNGSSVVHTFALKGNYTITLTVTDAAGNKGTATTWVLVKGPDGGGSGGGDGVGGLSWVLIAILVLIVAVIAAVGVLALKRRARDFGWAPTDGERTEKGGDAPPGDVAGKDALEDVNAIPSDEKDAPDKGD